MNSQTTEITDPLKMFDSFSELLKPISNQKKLPKERKGKERKGKERKGKERKGKERKGKERNFI